MKTKCKVCQQLVALEKYEDREVFYFQGRRTTRLTIKHRPSKHNCVRRVKEVRVYHNAYLETV